MFRKLLTYLTMTTVVLHALLGCCMHHAHAGHTHCHDVAQVIVDVPHVVGFCDAGHNSDGHSHEAPKTSCQNQRVVDGSSSRDCLYGKASDAGPHQLCSVSDYTCSHGPHESCDKADCNIVADQRDNDFSLILSSDWSPILTDSLSLSSQNSLALRTVYSSPLDPHCVQLPLRIRTQVWRL
ncbi:hypothetical protein Mal33_13500 [Rosistilla oblonga]|uniref:YHYH domain-containing protein n=1 Tax=Rosistilla oblonga TaxID=2527990 RepID=A0A518IQL6_9BACT|nr:hypothetical protein Mal33_13500 [Rosistilla oblonga]